MANTSSSLHHKSTEDVTSYCAVNGQDSSFRFEIRAASDLGAKAQLLEKLGYAIVYTGNAYLLVDLDDDSKVGIKLESNTQETAHDEVLASAGWRLTEPTMMMGGAMGAGFGIDDEYTN